jgi:type I restriction enzyme S subunit
MDLNNVEFTWIKNKPDNWRIHRVKNHFILTKNKTDFPEGYPILSLTMKGIIERDINSNEGQLPETYKGYNLLNKDDIVFNPMDLISGWVDCSPFEGLISPSYKVLRPISNDVNIKFYTYYFQTHYKEKIFFPFGEGVHYEFRWGLGTETLRNFPVVVPPITEQQKIVSFLDTKTSLIDSLIEKTLRKIELLNEKRVSVVNEVITKGLNSNVEMKYSGVEWIGEIPISWTKTKISRFCEVKDGTHDTPKYVEVSDKSIPLVTSNSFINGEIDFTKSKRISYHDYIEINKRSDVEVNDVIMSMIGSNIGNKVLVKTEKPFSIKNVCLFKTSKSPNLDPKYLIYLIESKYLKYQVDFNQKGGGQPFLSLDILRGLLFPFPPISEQQQIVGYLDEQTGLIDKTISVERKRLILLKEYRQSLISEVVTGKQKVV